MMRIMRVEEDTQDTLKPSRNRGGIRCPNEGFKTPLSYFLGKMV